MRWFKHLTTAHDDPADGISGYSTLPGYSTEDAEMRYIEREQQAQSAWLSPAEALAQLVEPGAAQYTPPFKQLSDGTIELKQTPPNAYELGILQREANDERLTAEARERAKRILERRAAELP